MGIAAVRARECPVVPRAAYPGRRLCMVPECRRRDRVAREPRAGNSQGKGLDRSRHGAPTTVAVWLQQRRRHGGQSVDRDARSLCGPYHEWRLLCRRGRCSAGRCPCGKARTEEQQEELQYLIGTTDAVLCW